MTLSAPKTIFGVHSLTLYDRVSLIPYGIIKVLGNLEFNFSSESIDLYGGSSRFPWESESGVVDAKLSGTIKEIPNFAFSKFIGASVTENAAETSGNVGTLTNKKGTSLMNATTGIASFTALAGSEADLKDGLYVVEAASATTVNIYCMSDYDFNKGTSKNFADDALKIIASAQTVTSGGDTNLTGFGLKFTGGSGTIAMTTGDTAYFFVRKINSKSDIITVGSTAQTFPEFGILFASQKKGSGDTFEGQIFRAKANGLPLPMSEKGWLESSIVINCLYDSAEDAVVRFRRIAA